MNPFEKINKPKIESESGLDKFQGIDQIQKALETKAANNYLYTHITDESTAEKIFHERFRVSMGIGISGTLSFTGALGAVNQIEKIMNGESPHRGLTGMVIIAIPKDLFPEHGEEYKYTTNALENYLEESGNIDGVNYVIPQEYNFGYLKGDTLYTHS